MHKYLFFILIWVSSVFSIANTTEAYFTFDNNIIDSNGTYSGTAHGDLSYVTGILNNGVYFNNEDHADSEYKKDYIELPNISLNQFSLSIWIKFERNSHYKEHDAAFYSIGSEDDGGTFFSLFVDENNRLFATLYCNDNNNIKVYQTDDLNITDGQWHHIAVTVGDSAMTMFEDGILGNSTNTNFQIEIINQPQFFCYHQWENSTKGSSRINGAVDEVKIFPNLLSEVDITNLFHLTDSGLIALYSFEGNMNNSQNNTIDGNIFGNTSFTTGKKGLGLKFNTVEHTSTEFIGDYASLPNISISDFTIMFWLKYNDNASNINPSAIYTFGSKDTGGDFFGALVDNDKKLNAYFYHDNHDNLYFRDNFVDLSDGLWHHITISVSKDNMKIYDNSELIAERKTGFTINIKNQAQYLGLLPWNNGESKACRFIGELDELRIFNYELTKSEIEEIFSEDKDGYTNTSYLPHFDISEFWETNLSITNFSTEKQEFLINVFSNSGEKFSSLDISLEAGGLLSLNVSSLFPSLTVTTGWLKIKTYTKLIKGMATYKFMTTESETSLPIVFETGKNYLFPLMEHSDSRNSGIAFTNTETDDTTITLSLVDETGLTIKTVSIELPSLNKKAFMLTDIFGDFDNKKVSLKIKSSQTNICSYGLTFINNNSAIVAVPGTIDN